MPTCRALPASWQMWSMLSTARSRVTVGFVLPRDPAGLQHDGVEGHAQNAVAFDHHA